MPERILFRRNVAQKVKTERQARQLMVLLQNESLTRQARRLQPNSLRSQWPDAVTLREVLQTPETSLSSELDLCLATVAVDRNGFPLTYTGRFAVVFRLLLPGNLAVALRIFTTPDKNLLGNREARSRKASETLTQWQAEMGDILPPFVSLPDAVRVAGQWYPAQVLPWAEGEPLLSFVARNRADSLVLRTLAQTVQEAIHRLEAAGIAHGDLQHDNLLVTNQGQRITLVDYDGIYTKELAEFGPPVECGHPNYQHPNRGVTHYGPGMDRFAASVIRTALLLLATAPQTWEQFDGDFGEGLLFTAADFAQPSQSDLFAVAHQYADTDTELAVALHDLKTLCQTPEINNLVTDVLTRDTPISPPIVYPSWVTPTCDAEKVKPVSYLAPLQHPIFARKESIHIFALRGYLLLAPPLVCLFWLMAWDAGGAKWPFLAYLFALLAGLQIVFFYLTWGVKQQHDALELEAAKLREAQRLNAVRERELLAQLSHWDKQTVPGGNLYQERAHILRAFALIPLSRAIGDRGVSAFVIRELREQNIETAGQLWLRHGFFPRGIDRQEAALLRVWLEEIEQRERERYMREVNPATVHS